MTTSSQAIASRTNNGVVEPIHATLAPRHFPCLVSARYRDDGNRYVLIVPGSEHDRYTLRHGPNSPIADTYSDAVEYVASLNVVRRRYGLGLIVLS